jgi:amino acid adenylation domain-containing protein/thioester reductase-like protein
LDEKEKKQWLNELNKPGDHAGNPGNKTLVELFAEQVEQTPDAIAVTGPGLDSAGTPREGERAGVTYRELDRKAAGLAKVLRNKGIQRDNAAAICLERSIGMVIAILAILKAGGAYLPIEPGTPDDRVNYMLSDSSTDLFLTTRYLSEWGKKYGDNKFGGENIFIEEYPGTLDVTLHPGSNPLPANLAYIIYTSGTTGRPRGVLVEHRNVVNYTGWRLETYGITAQDVTLQLLSFAFDAFASNFYSSLFSGGVLAMIPDSRKMDYEYIRKVVREERVTNLSLVPAMYEALIDSAGPGDTESLRFVVLGGEKASANLIKKSREKNPQNRHIIEYGPTETTICTAANIGISPQDTTVIGRTIVNTRAYILDRFHHPQPTAVPGELFITGAGVARGYLNKPGLTAEKFDHDLWDLQDYHDEKRQKEQAPGKGIYRSYIYRTGDLARWLSDGNIEFLGRIDQQVKIRGFRVEVEEVENVLLRHQDVEQCIVIPRESSRGSELELMAYYKKKENTKITTTGIRESLTHQLPDYMRPSHLIELDEFPLTPNGKIDRKALAGLEEFETEEELLKPGNEIEKRILEVFKQVIDIEEIGVNSGFFDVGGTSIRAIFAQAQLSKEFNISVDHFYQYRNIREMANNITWKKDNPEAIIRELKEKPKMGPGAVEEYKTREKEVEKAHHAYIQQIEKEDLADITAEKEYRHIFLTGGTGYLGSHLVYRLLETTEAQLHLLVRGDTPRDGEERLKRKLDFYFEGNFFETNRDRLHAVVGDLRGEHLGIDDTVYGELVGITDAVIHAAADNREFGMYEDFHKVNVVGTENLLELVKEGKKKDLHHISTLQIAPDDIQDQHAAIFSEYCLDVGQIHKDRTRSNLEAEKKVIASRENGSNASIYRVGQLTFHSKTGKFRENIENDKFFTQLKAFITLGMGPEDDGMLFDPCFIDHTAASIVKLMTRKHLYNQTYHIRNPHELTWKDMQSLLHKTGIAVTTVKVNQFLDYLMECIRDDKYFPEIFQLMRYAGLFIKRPANSGIHIPARVVSDRTERILKRLGLQWENLNESHTGKMIGYCKQQDILQ